MKLAPLHVSCLVISCGLLQAQDGIATKTTYAKAYGPTNNEVMVDPAKELPRYPAVEAKDANGTWQVKKGFKLELAACEPLVRDPIALCFDERGRMFVCEMIDYSEMRDVTPHLGRISVLEDQDGDGFYETGTVFADNLPWPTGLIWANGGLYVGATPDIWRFEDRDGDGKAEVREKIFTGFGTGLKIINVQGMLNSFQWGQDNRIHVLAGGGNRGVITSITHPETPGLELGGKDFWFDPLTHEFGLEAGGAQYGMSFDDYGRKFGCSNSDHLQHWIYADKYAGRNPHYAMQPARQSIAVDGGAAEVFRISPDEPWRIIRTRWRVAGVVKGAVEGGGRVSGYFTGATGTTLYRGDAYGAEFVNNSFTGDAGGQLIHRKIIRPAADGITLEGERPADERGFEFAASSDTWVRVVNFANAPDGCLHVCDMYREVIEHPWSIPDEIKKHLDLNSGNDRGRIWRIVPEGERPERVGKKVQLAAASTEALVRTLSHTNGWHRDTAQRLLFERRDPVAVVPLHELLKGGDAVTKLHALGALESAGALTEASVAGAMHDADERVVERAIQLSERYFGAEKPPGSELARAWLNLAHAESPRVRFQVALSAAAVFEKLPTDALERLPVEWRSWAGITDVPLAILQKGTPADAKITDAFLASAPDAALMLLSRASEGAAEARLPAETLTKVLQAAAAAVLLEPKWFRKAERKVTPAMLVAFVAADPRPEHVAALARGFKAGGSSLEKADAEGRLGEVFAQAATSATERQTHESARIEAIGLLGVSGSKAALGALIACLADAQSEPVQVAALRVLAQTSAAAVASAIIENWPHYGTKAQSAAVEALLAREERTLALLEAKVVRPEVFSATQVQALIQHKSPQVAAAAKAALAAVIPPSREEVAKTFAPAVSLKGDVNAGRNHYIGRCMACHRAEGLGIEVGPDLITVKTKGRDALLSAILDPHKEVASQYIAYTVSTKDGQTLSGIITQDDASSLTLRMMGGASVSLQRSAIQGTASAGQSLMPEGLETGMDAQDMADLLTFIEELL